MNIIHRLRDFIMSPVTWLNLAMIGLFYSLVISQRPTGSIIVYSLPFVGAARLVLSPFFSGGFSAAIATVVALVLVLMAYRSQFWRYFGTLKAVLLGRGWAAWAMFWLWVCLYFLLIQPSLLYTNQSLLEQTIASINTNDGVSSSVSPFSIIAVALALAIFHRSAKRSEAFPRRAFVVALIVGLILNFGLMILFVMAFRTITGIPLVFGAGFPDDLLLLNLTLFLVPVYSLAPVLIVAVRTGYGTVLRFASLVILGGSLVSMFLLYPAYTWVYSNFVPQQSYAGTAHDTTVMAYLIAAALVCIFTGMAAVWLKPRSWQQRVAFGAALGLCAAMMAYTLIGSWSAGIAAQESLYGFAIDRDGYNAAEWTLKLGIAVNNLLPASLATFFAFCFAGTILATLGAFIIPLRCEAPANEKKIPFWILLSLLSSILIQSSMATNFVVFNVLEPNLENLLVRYGYAMFFNMEWGIFGLTLTHYPLLVLMQLSLIVWLNRSYLGKERPAANHVFLNALSLYGILGIFISLVQLSVQNFWWSAFIAVLCFAMNLEIFRLSRVILRDESPLRYRRNWVQAGVLSGVLGFLLTCIMVSISLSLVLISVVLIAPLADPTAAAPGIQYLLDTIGLLPLIAIGATGMALPLYILIALVLSFIVVMNLPAIILKMLVEPGSDWTRRLITRIRSFRLLLPLGVVLAFLIDLLISVPVFSFLLGLQLIRPATVKKLPAVVIALTLGLLAVGLLLIHWQTLAYDSTVQTALVLIPMAYLSILLYHSMAVYVPESKRSYRYLSYALLFAIAYAALIFASTPIVERAGGVSRYDASGWTVFNNANSNLGSNVAIDLLEQPDGSLWFINSGGIISIYDGNEWELAQLSALTPGFDDTFTASEGTELLHSDGGQLFFTTGSRFYQIQNTDETILPFECVPSPACSTVSDEAIRGFAVLGENDYWHGGEYGLFRLYDQSWVYQTVSFEFQTEINHLLGDGDNLWIATDKGLFYYTASDDCFHPILEAGSGEIFHLYLDTNGMLWYATTEGLWRMGETALPELVISAEELLNNASPQVTAMTDAEGIYWIGTSNGLLRYNSISGEREYFNSVEDGLVVDAVHDMLLDNSGNLWVSTYESSSRSTPNELLIAGFILFIALIGGGIARDYRNSPGSHAKRQARKLAKSKERYYAEVYDFLAEAPSEEVLQTAANELNRLGLPFGGAGLLAYQDLLYQPDAQNALTKLREVLAQDGEQHWATALMQEYELMQAALAVSHITDIHELELLVNPAQTGGMSSLSSAKSQLNLAPFVPQESLAVWQALSVVGSNLRKYAEVNDTGDRLSYLAAALSAVELAQSQSKLVPLPESVILRQIVETWRLQIGDAINTLSGSAELRLELRTRQIRRSETVTLVLKLENIGRAAAENIEVKLLEGETELASIHLERLSLNRSESIEFSLSPPAENTARLYFRACWDDRLAKGKTIEYADEVRFYETAEEFQTIPNPYIVGHPVKSSQMFFGREDVFQFIEQNLRGAVQDRTIVLYGQRRTGKTSLLYQLVEGRLGEEFIAVLIDMQALVLLVETTADFLAEILYQLGQRLENSDIKIDIPEITADTPSPNRLFNRFIDNLCRELGKRRLLLIFDEFELIEGKIAEGKLDANILDYFRSLIQHRDNLVFIFTGTHRLEEMSHDYWSILFNIALSRKISFLSEADTRKLIRNPLEGKLTVDDLAIEKIIRLTSGHPFFTQLLCWALVNHCNQARRNYASINDVNDALDAMLATGEAHFAFSWQQATENQQLFMAALAQGDDSWLQAEELIESLRQHGAESFTRTQAIELLDALLRQEILEATTEGALRYRFRLGVLQRWIKNNKSISSLVSRKA